MNPAESLANEAVQLLNTRRFEDAINTYMRALSADPKREETWTGLTLAFALAGRFSDLIGLADYRQRSRGDGFAVFYNGLLAMMTYELHDHVLELAKFAGDESVYAPATVYQAGCIFLLRGEEDRAFERFTAFKRLAVGRSDLPIGPESPFNIAYRQGTLIEDKPYIAALLDQEGGYTPAEACFHGELRHGRSEYVIVAACDWRYFELYAEGMVESIAVQEPDATVHLHIANTWADASDSIERLRAAYPTLALNFSTEATGPVKSGAYYASLRFLIGPALLSAYRKRLVLTDIDILVQQPLFEMITAMKHADFTCFRHDGAGPCSRYPAVLTSFAANEQGASMFDLLDRFIRSKLDVPWPFNWMLDQAALSSVLRYVTALRPDIKTEILNDLTGHSYRRWIHPIADDAKAHLIRNAGAT